jgi:hypothetical protein
MSTAVATITPTAPVLMMTTPTLLPEEVPALNVLDQMGHIMRAPENAPPATLSAVLQHEQQMRSNTQMASDMFKIMGVYDLILPAGRGSVESLMALAFSPMRIYHGPVPWIQRPIRGHGTGIQDPVAVRDAIYAQRFTGIMPTIKLAPFSDTESLESYIAMLETQVEQANVSNIHGFTFEEQNLTHLRLLAAHDLLMLRTADKSLGLNNASETAEVMEKFRLSERALRALNAINRARADSRPPKMLTSDPPTGWWFVTSDDLMVTYMLNKEQRLHRSKDAFVGANDGRINMMRTTPHSIMSELQQRFGTPIDVLFPDAPSYLGSIRKGNDRNRCISVGLLPLVMAFMDDRFLHLNPVRAVSQYVHNLLRTQLRTLMSPSLYYDASVQQLSHNIDWCAQLDSVSESNVVYATHLYASAHQMLMSRFVSKQRAALALCRDFIGQVTDPATAEKVMVLANTYGDQHASLMGKGQTILAEFEENIFRDTHNVLVKQSRSSQRHRKRAASESASTGENAPAFKRARTADEPNISGMIPPGIVNNEEDDYAEDDEEEKSSATLHEKNESHAVNPWAWHSSPL